MEFLQKATRRRLFFTVLGCSPEAFNLFAVPCNSPEAGFHFYAFVFCFAVHWWGFV
ncbi:hypothetical protein [Desulfatibacillum alkenivorans]|uniref:hypothetical protein n=1 Tax=Desulfatibacillum alkenivorans TaxID=259354 RepID=UPI001480CEC3|nr:hypothetical protein [Desulfatibacillum alkenivorans]